MSPLSREDRRAAFSASHGDISNSNYEAFVLAVSLLSVVNDFLILFFRGEAQRLLLFVNAGLCLLFFADFLFRLWKAPRKRSYLFGGGGMLDLLSSVPYPWFFGLARLLRVVRATLALNRFGRRRIRGVFMERLAEGAVVMVIFLVIIVLEVGGQLVLWVESGHQGSNILTAGDALWWGYVTITSVGYGDRFPVSSAGRIIGVVMLTVGLTLLATVTGFVANTFLSRLQSVRQQPGAPGPAEGATGAGGSQADVLGESEVEG